MWTDRQILGLTVFVTAVVSGLTALSTGDWVITAISIPFVASAAFWSLHLSRRVGRWLQRRYAPPIPSPSRAADDDAPSHVSERPEHAQRRRRRRRQRGRREGPS
jgi:hypothetical protein